MSYSRPPKSPYGDTEFTDDSWSQQGTTSLPPPLLSQNYAPLRDQPSIRQPSPNYEFNAAAAGASGQQQPSLMASPADLSNIARSITQEDILFTRGWQRDSYIQRVLPLTAVSSGILYFYNKQKNLPNKISRYIMLAGLSYVIGKWSYRHEFKRRLMTSQSNTPYMQALRRAFGLPPHVEDSVFDTSTTGFGSSNYGFEDSSKSFSGYQQYSGGNPSYYSDHAYQPADKDNQGLESGKPATSYEELRAKNRGYIK